MRAGSARTVHLALTALAASCTLFLLGQTAFTQQNLANQGPDRPRVSSALFDRAVRDGRVRVLVELNLPGGHIPEGQLSNPARLGQRQRLIAQRTRVLSRLSPAAYRALHQFQTIPWVAIEANVNALTALQNAGSDVVRIVDDALVRPVLSESVPLIQGDQAWAVGYDGTGTTIAVLDTGVDASHPFLSNKVVEEACFSGGGDGLPTTSFCPNGQPEQIGPGAAAPCWMDGCYHGTHVAGIAAGNGAGASVPFSGVAKNANIMAVQVFTEIDDLYSCGGMAPCLGGFTSDIIAGLERVYAVAPQLNIAAVNLSLGEGQFSSACDGQPYKPIIDNLRSIGVATVAAAGNDSFTDSMLAPACISSAVSVGATDRDDQVAWFSDVAPFLSLFAPGVDIVSSIPGGDFAPLSGTSMATPHVAGAFAILRQALPTASVTTLVEALQETGLPVTDTRTGTSTTTVPRINIFEALASLTTVDNPAPTLTSIDPVRVRAGGPGLTLTLTGSGFDAFSVVRWNGMDRPSKVVSTTQMTASISSTDLASLGSAEVAVFTPQPGGGSSAAVTFIIDPPPTLTLSAQLVPVGGSETVTLHDGLGGAQDFIGLYATGSPDPNYVQYTYVGAGVTDRTWTVTMPSTPGTYEFRLFKNNAFVRAATSPAVTVSPNSPTVTSLSPPSAIAGGAAITLTVSGTNFVTASTVRWNGADRPTTYVSATQLRATIAASDLATVGTAQVTVFTPPPGGGTSSALTFSIKSTPSLAVSTTTATGGTSVTVTLSNGLGGSTDWIALAASGSADTSYVQWTYVGADVTTRTWTVTMPSTAGAYQFRLFLNNGFTRAATSPDVTITLPAPTVTSLSPTTAVVGSGPTTLDVFGTNFVAASVVRWNGANRPTTYVSATQLRTTIAASDLATGGTAQVTVYSPPPGGGTSTALTFSIRSTTPSLTVSTTSAAGGGQVTVTLSNGLGGSSDWLALAPSASGDTSYSQWTYVGAGVTTRTWTATMPSAAGTYQFRLFLNGGYTRAATSPDVTVSAGPPTVTSLSPTSTVAGSGPMTLDVFGGNFATSSIVRWNGADRPTTYVSATQLRTTIGSSDLAAVGTAQVTVYSPPPGGGTSASALPFSIRAVASLVVSTTTAPAGTQVTVTLSNGLGGSTDWMALAVSASANTSYMQYTYVGGGLTTRTWTVTMPSTPGTYQFRLFLNNGYTRAATSADVTVVATGP